MVWLWPRFYTDTGMIADWAQHIMERAYVVREISLRIFSPAVLVTPLLLLSLYGVIQQKTHLSYSSWSAQISTTYLFLHFPRHISLTLAYGRRCLLMNDVLNRLCTDQKTRRVDEKKNNLVTRMAVKIKLTLLSAASYMYMCMYPGRPCIISCKLSMHRNYQVT